MGRVVKVQVCAAGSAPPLVESSAVEIVARYFVLGSSDATACSLLPPCTLTTRGTSTGGVESVTMLNEVTVSVEGCTAESV